MLRKRGQPERKPQNEPQPICGLISCASCGMMITGEHKLKRQKNGNVHEYTYYRCTKKRKDYICKESAVREEEMDRQLSSLIQKVSLPKDWAEELNRMALGEHKNSAQSLTLLVKEKETRKFEISQKLERLLNGYLDQVIDEQDYRSQKAKLLSEKKSLEEEISNFSHKQSKTGRIFCGHLTPCDSIPPPSLWAKKLFELRMITAHPVFPNEATSRDI